MGPNPQHRDQAIVWAQGVLATQDNWLVLDTETTGLDDKAEVCQIAMVRLNGQVIMESLVRPTLSIPADVTKIHGITNEDVEGCPTIRDIVDTYWWVLTTKNVLIYNADYDTRVINQSMKAHGGTGIEMITDCVMKKYAAFRQTWDWRKGGYKWHKLTVDSSKYRAHSASGDCLATIDLIKGMAHEGIAVDPLAIV